MLLEHGTITFNGNVSGVDYKSRRELAIKRNFYYTNNFVKTSCILSEHQLLILIISIHSNYFLIYFVNIRYVNIKTQSILKLYQGTILFNFSFFAEMEPGQK